MVEIALAVVAALALIIVIGGTYKVDQSWEYVVERMGKYDRTLKPGFHFLLPILNKVSHKIHILETQIPETIGVITKDNVEIDLHAVVFYRIIDAARSVYRIEDLKSAIRNTVVSITRAKCGQMEFDEIQGHRESISDQIKTSLLSACDIWGVEITRTEILDVVVNEATKKAMQLQLNSERERRAAVTKAEGVRDSAMLQADALLYTAQKEADARRVQADAEAYATTTISRAISENGQASVNFELAKAQIHGWTEISKSNGAKLIIIPTEVSKSLGSLAAMIEAYRDLGR